MRVNDEKTAEYIAELQAQIEDAHVTIDLLQESLNERTDELRAAKGQLAQLRADRRVEVA